MEYALSSLVKFEITQLCFTDCALRSLSSVLPDTCKSSFFGPQLSHWWFHSMYRLRHDQRRAFQHMIKGGEVEGSAFRKYCPINQFVSTVRVRRTKWVRCKWMIVVGELTGVWLQRHLFISPKNHLVSPHEVLTMVTYSPQSNWRKIFTCIIC